MGLTLEVRSVGGDAKVKIQVKYTDTVAAVKDLIERRTNLGRAVNLVFRGAVLDDDKQLSQTALRDGDLLIATTTTSSDTTASTAPRDADTDPRPRPSKRCAACGVAVGLVAQQMRCRCSQVFCDKHRRPEQHQCPVDAGLAQKERLRAQLMPAMTPNDAQGWRGVSQDQKTGRKLHAAGIACVILGIATAGASYCRGAGLQTCVFTVASGCAFGFSLSTWAHSRYCESGGSKRKVACNHMWGRAMLVSPARCVKWELSNLLGICIDIVTLNETNCLTRTLAPYKRRYAA